MTFSCWELGSWIRNEAKLGVLIWLIQRKFVSFEKFPSICHNWQHVQWQISTRTEEGLFCAESVMVTWGTTPAKPAPTNCHSSLLVMCMPGTLIKSNKQSRASHDKLRAAHTFTILCSLSDCKTSHPDRVSPRLADVLWLYLANYAFCDVRSNKIVI